jgi:hypothetical protein
MAKRLHENSASIDPFEFLKVQQHDDGDSLHFVRRKLEDGRPILLLTEAGRRIICSHISGSYPQTCLATDLVASLSVNSQVNPPTKLNSWGFHFLNLLWNFRGIALRRSDLNALKSALADSFGNHPHPEWFPKRSEDDDIIQHVNKTSQWGLKHNSATLKSPNGDLVNYYWISMPLQFCAPSTLRKQGVTQSFITSIPKCNCLDEPDQDSSERDSDRDLVLERMRVISYLTDAFLNVPLKDWTLEGHRDAQNKELGTVAQPKKFNRSARDRWKFDDYGLTRCPSVVNLISNLRSFYPSDEELIQLAEALQRELDNSSTEL